MSRVLVVDDSAVVRNYFSSILQSAGYLVDEATNGYEGVEKALANSYSIFLVDINMPKMTGYEFVRQLRQVENTAHLPVIMISSEAGDEDKNEAYRAAANVYLTKPVKPEILLAMVKLLTGWRLDSNVDQYLY